MKQSAVRRLIRVHDFPSAMQFEEIEGIGVVEDQIRSQPVGIAQLLQLVLDNLLGFPGKGGALVEHGIDLLLERPRAPRFDATHFGIKIALERIVLIDDV